MHTEVVSVLIDIESELRRVLLWDAEAPSAEALESDQPFAMDTLSLPQWLQFVFLPTMHSLVEQGQPLPQKSAIAPMAEEHFRGTDIVIDGLLVALEHVDQLLSGEKPDYSLPQRSS